MPNVNRGPAIKIMRISAAYRLVNSKTFFSLAWSPVEITDKIRSDDDTYIMIVYFITVK